MKRLFMENSAGNTAQRLKRIGFLLCGVVMGLAWADCNALSQGRQVTGNSGSVAEGHYEGVVALPDPTNPWTGMKITDEKCFVRVRYHEPGALAVESSFSEETVMVHADSMSGQFYMGRFGDDQALVLQLRPSGGVIALTHTSFDGKGVLNYGVKGEGDFTKECLDIIP